MAITRYRKNKQVITKSSVRKPVKARYPYKARARFKARYPSKARARFKKSVKKYKRKWKKKPVKRAVKVVALAKQPPLPLNIDFYSVTDGVYSSYWTGKLISTLQRKGKKKTVAKHFYKAATMLKLSFAISPLLILLETLDKIKPTFRLRNRIVRRSIIKEYPIVVLRPKQLMLAVHWLKEEIHADSAVFGASLTTRIAAKLLDFKLNPKKNNLVKKRNEYIRRTIKAQFNIRYNFK